MLGYLTIKPHILTLSHLHPHTITPTHHHILTPSHHHTHTPSHPHTFTSSHPHTFTSLHSHLHTHIHRTMAPFIPICPGNPGRPSGPGPPCERREGRGEKMRERGGRNKERREGDTAFVMNGALFGSTTQHVSCTCLYLLLSRACHSFLRPLGPHHALSVPSYPVNIIARYNLMCSLCTCTRCPYTLSPGGPTLPASPGVPSTPGVPGVPCESRETDQLTRRSFQLSEQLTGSPCFPRAPLVPLSPFSPFKPYEKYHMIIM